MADGFNQLDQQLTDSEYDQGLPVAYSPSSDTDERPIQFQHANVWGRFAMVTGLVSALAGLAMLAHAIAPARLGVIGQVAVSAWAGVSLGFALLTVVMVIIAKHADTTTDRHRAVGSAGIILLLCGILFTVAGVIIANGHPQGLIRAKEIDTAPIDSAQAMTRGIDRAAGTCASGWQDGYTGSFVGISQFRFCPSNKVGYVVFSDDSSASLAKGPILSQGRKLMDKYTGSQGFSASDRRLLSGKRWVVIGNTDQMTKLQTDWGGHMDSLESDK